jgi:hypothetical protein
MTALPTAAGAHSCQAGRCGHLRGGGPGEDTSSPSMLANGMALGIVVQVGHRCPAVKVERPQRSEDGRP